MINQAATQLIRRLSTRHTLSELIALSAKLATTVDASATLRGVIKMAINEVTSDMHAEAFERAQQTFRGQ